MSDSIDQLLESVAKDLDGGDWAGSDVQRLAAHITELSDKLSTLESAVRAVHDGGIERGSRLVELYAMVASGPYSGPFGPGERNPKSFLWWPTRTEPAIEIPHPVDRQPECCECAYCSRPEAAAAEDGEN